MCLFCYVFHPFLTQFMNLILKHTLGAFQLKFRQRRLLFDMAKSELVIAAGFGKLNTFLMCLLIPANCWMFVSVTLIVLRPTCVLGDVWLCIFLFPLNSQINITYVEVFHSLFHLLSTWVGYSCGRNAACFRTSKPFSLHLEGLLISFVLMWDPSMWKKPQESMNCFIIIYHRWCD